MEKSEQIKVRFGGPPRLPFTQPLTGGKAEVAVPITCSIHEILTLAAAEAGVALDSELLEACGMEDLPLASHFVAAAFGSARNGDCTHITVIEDSGAIFWDKPFKEVTLQELQRSQAAGFWSGDYTDVRVELDGGGFHGGISPFEDLDLWLQVIGALKVANDSIDTLKNVLDSARSLYEFMLRHRNWLVPRHATTSRVADALKLAQSPEVVAEYLGISRNDAVDLLLNCGIEPTEDGWAATKTFELTRLLLQLKDRHGEEVLRDYHTAEERDAVWQQYVEDFLGSAGILY